MINISHISLNEPLKIILGAGEQSYSGWIATQQEQLDVVKRNDWEASFSNRRIDALLCEHVWEHLTEEQGRLAASICYEYLKPGGYLRCAVPDGNFPDGAYQNMIRIGGPGPKDHPAADHKIVYDYELFVDTFRSAGFEVDLLEYCDNNGRFHYNYWNPEDGLVYRSLLFDHRNQGGKLKSVSIMLDAKKP